MSDDDELSLLLLNEFRHQIAASSQCVGLCCWCGILASGFRLSGRLEACILLQLGLGTILLQDFEELECGLFVQRLRELVDWWRNLQALLQDCLVTLNTDVLGPADEAGKIALGLGALT